MTDYKDLSKRLRAYSAERKGEIADLTMEAAEAIDALTDGDLISRKAALEAIYALHEDGKDGIENEVEATARGDHYYTGVFDAIDKVEDVVCNTAISV